MGTREVIVRPDPEARTVTVQVMPGAEVPGRCQVLDDHVTVRYNGDGSVAAIVIREAVLPPPPRGRRQFTGWLHGAPNI